ncbi:MAG: M4 family metallopeptidase, partial [Synergistaceae bacterium]|nr:M4 family metallopeptidase [Synergistaceae bacterium]
KSMRDSGTDGLPEVIIYSGGKSDTDIPKVSYFVSTSNSWNDEHQVSAYTNMRTVIRWWKDTFNRNSLDDKGMTINLVTHVSRLNDNACWNSATETISVGDIGNTSEYNLTRAMGLDTLTHETGHAVLHYVTGGIPYQNATGAIDDGYADIFGCLRDQDWRHGWRADNDGDPETGITYFIDKTACLRDAREDISVKSLSESARSSYGLSGIKTMAELYDHYGKVLPYGNDGNGCHTYCRLVTHAAYLMHQDGASDIGRSSTQALTWYELGRVWYKSLSMGLDSTSNFHTVRRNVIRAARQFRLPEMKIITIKKAFDKVEISEAKGTLKGSIEDWDNGEMITGGATITLRGSSGLVEEKAAMDSKGNFELKADAGNYTLLVSPTYGSYRPYQTRIYIPADRTVNTEVELVKTGTGTLDVYLYDTNSHTVNGAAVSITNDYTSVSRSPSSWTSTGKYTFQNVNSGYYTVYVSKSGYDDHSFKVIVPPGKGTTRKIFMTLYAATNARYMVCLESSKTFLEPHMLMKYSNGTMQDVNKNDVHTFAPNGRESGRYSSQNSGKIKYTLYTNFVSTEYKYYVAWDGSEKADWNGARPGVWLYYKGSLLKKYSPPKEAQNGSFWEVFGISKKGSRYTVNEIREDEPTIE